MSMHAGLPHIPHPYHRVRFRWESPLCDHLPLSIPSFWMVKHNSRYGRIPYDDGKDIPPPSLQGRVRELLVFVLGTMVYVLCFDIYSKIVLCYNFISMYSRLLITTKNDLSVNYFSNWDIIYLEEYSSTDIDIPIYNKVYLRDPFNNPSVYTPDEAVIDAILHKSNADYYIDRVDTFARAKRLEDKYLQYKTYGNLMPETYLATKREFIEGEYIIKPRISQRAKNIIFTKEDLLKKYPKIKNDLIIQKRMDIKEELRIYIVKGAVNSVACVKTSKASGMVKVVGERTLNRNEVEFALQCYSRNKKLDFIGLDVAVLDDLSLKLIEVNRSPQFTRYVEFARINPVEFL